MKVVLLMLTFVLVAVAAGAGEATLQQLPPERFRSAGLHKLSAAELSALEAIVAELRQGGTVATAPASEPKKGPGWLRALTTSQEVAATPDAAEALETALIGDFSGWDGRTVFRLQNGQVWQQNDSSQRYEPSRTNPKVRIYPGMLGSYWMEVEGVRQRVKVKPIKLQ